MKAYIYSLLNLQNGKIYVGSTLNSSQRKSIHFKQLRKRVHENPKINKDLENFTHLDFAYNIIEVVDLNEIFIREEYWILTMNGLKGYNTKLPSEEAATVESLLKRIQTMKTKAKSFNLKYLSEEEWKKRKEENPDFKMSDLKVKKEPCIPNYKYFYQIDPVTGEIIKEWEGVEKTQRELGYILSSLKKNKEVVKYTDHGFIWCYKEYWKGVIERKPKKEEIVFEKPIVITIQNIKTGEIKEFSKLVECQAFLDIGSTTLKNFRAGWKIKNNKRVNITQCKGWRVVEAAPVNFKNKEEYRYKLAIPSKLCAI